MIQALKEHKGLITYACKAAGITRDAHYKWLKKSPEYKKAYEEIEDFMLDRVENAALDMIFNTDNPNPSMTIFYLKCKGKKRGFVERQEIEHDIGDKSKVREMIREYDESTESD